MQILWSVFVGLGTVWAHTGDSGYAPPELHFSALPELKCELMLAPSLPFTPTTEYPIELHRAAGFITHPGEIVPEVPSDFFLWQTWRNGDLAIVPQYDDDAFAANGVGVNTHEAAALLYEAEYGEPIDNQVLASGEGRWAFGQNWFRNNKSGKWQGGPETLVISRKVKLARGVPMTPWTTEYAVDRSKPEDMGHQPADRRYDQWQLEMRQQVLSQSDGPQLVKLYERFGRILRPHALGQGTLPDHRTVARRGESRDLALFLTQLLRRSPEAFLIAAPQYVLIHASSFDGIYYAIQSELHLLSTGQRAPELYEKYVMPPIIDRIIQRLPELSEVERDQLEQVKAGFAALEHRGVIAPDLNVLTHIEKPTLIYDEPAPETEH